MSLTDEQINGFLRSMTQVIKLEAKAMEISGDEVIAQFADICAAAIERNRLAGDNKILADMYADARDDERAWKYRAEKAEAELNKRASPPPVNNQRHLTRRQTGKTRNADMCPSVKLTDNLVIGQSSRYYRPYNLIRCYTGYPYISRTARPVLGCILRPYRRVDCG